MRISALNYALRLLQRRSRSVHELQRKLAEKKYTVEEISGALEKLEELTLVNDERFATNYTQDKVSIYRRGPRRIFLELLQRGVAKETADKAVKTISAEDELQAAESLASSRERQWQHLDPLKRKHRALSLLQRRGFSPKVIRTILDKYNI